MAIELMPQILSRNPPERTQITPNYTPIYQPIPLSTYNNKMINHGNDDETPFPRISKPDNKATPIAHKEEKYKLPPAPFYQKSSLYSTFKAIKSEISVGCFIEEPKLKKILGSFIVILLLANLVILITFVVYFFCKQDIGFGAANGALSYIAFSLAADPILDIQACPEGSRNLLLGTWPGTASGCGCSTYYHRGFCDKGGRGATERSCNDISSIKPINIYNWGGEEWCVSKAQLGSQYKRATKCPEGFRKCSSGICVLETLDCPITKVELTRGIILTERVVGEPPVIGFAITPNDIPCFSENYYASGPAAPYALIDKEDGCSKYGPDDQYSFALDKRKQDKIFDDNDFPMKVYDLPFYSNYYQTTDSVLSYRRRLSVAEKDFCLNMNTELLESPSDVTKDLNRLLFRTLIAALFIHGFLVSMVVDMRFIKKCTNASFSDILQGEGGRKAKIWTLLYFVLEVAEYIDLIVMFAAVVHFRSKMIVVSDYLKELSNEGCFLDLQAQSAVNDYQTAVNIVAENYFTYSLVIFLVGSFSVFSCSYLFWKVRRSES